MIDAAIYIYDISDWFAFAGYGVIVGFGFSLFIGFVTWCVYTLWQFFKEIIK